METWALDILVFLTAFFTVFAANAILLDLNATQRRRLNQELQEQLRQRERGKSQDFSQLSRLPDDPAQSRWQRLAILVEQSGLAITPNRLVTMSLGLAILAGLLGGLLTESPLLAAVAAVGTSTLPTLYVLYVRHQRWEKLLSQLPDAFDLMSRVLRSGQTISQAIEMVADEFSPPLSIEFYRCHEQIRLGLTTDAALHDMVKRVGLLEIKIFAVAVLVQQQTGGNLSELFDQMSAIVRERFRIRGLVKSLTAQGRMQAVILLSLPVGMFAFLMAIRPDYEMMLLDYPIMIATAIGLLALGTVWIHRIIHFDY
jgi:tight adherence protein B